MIWELDATIHYIFVRLIINLTLNVTFDADEWNVSAFEVNTTPDYALDPTIASKLAGMVLAE